jgi:hypothetical protein
VDRDDQLLETLVRLSELTTGPQRQEVLDVIEERRELISEGHAPATAEGDGQPVA